MTKQLEGHELEIAGKLWHDLREGVPGAPEQLRTAPEKVRDAILEALMVSISTGQTPRDPFVDILVRRDIG